MVFAKGFILGGFTMLLIVCVIYWLNEPVRSKYDYIEDGSCGNPNLPKFRNPPPPPRKRPVLEPTIIREDGKVNQSTGPK